MAQKTQKNGLCGSVCSRSIYSSALNYLSERVLSKELKVYGKGYCIIWAFYSSLYVNEKIETYVFDFDTALVAVGGSLGLFLGKESTLKQKRVKQLAPLSKLCRFSHTT